jgi:hypothetical protein
VLRCASHIQNGAAFADVQCLILLHQLSEMLQANPVGTSGRSSSLLMTMQVRSLDCIRHRSFCLLRLLPPDTLTSGPQLLVVQPATH